VCNGRLEFIGKFNPDGTRAAEREATAFSLFVKQHFAARAYTRSLFSSTSAVS